jgi:hypothetical protein
MLTTEIVDRLVAYLQYNVNMGNLSDDNLKRLIVEWLVLNHFTLKEIK